MLRGLGRTVGARVRALGEALEAGGKSLGVVPEEAAFVDYRPSEHSRLIEVQLFLKNASEAVVERPTKFVAPSAQVDEDTQLADGSSVWYNAVVKGGVSVGPKAIVQDHAVVEGAKGKPTLLGSNVSVAPRARIGAGSTLGDGVVIGSGATLEAGVVVESDAVVGQGALVPAGTTIKARELWAGNPAALVRTLEVSELTTFAERAATISERALVHANWMAKDAWTQDMERQAFKDRSEWLEDVLEDHTGPAWSVDVNMDMEPDYFPERPGIVYDKIATDKVPVPVSAKQTN